MTRCSALRTCTTFVRPPNFSSQSLETHWNRVSHESPVHSVFPLVENESAVNVILRVFAHVYSYVCIYIYIYVYEIWSSVAALEPVHHRSLRV